MGYWLPVTGLPLSAPLNSSGGTLPQYRLYIAVVLQLARKLLDDTLDYLVAPAWPRSSVPAAAREVRNSADAGIATVRRARPRRSNSYPSLPRYSYLWSHEA